ncbi:hypothetical protein FIBSPDRAFT_964742 [Athelia psychrophila]|uniref:Uncharacterized protein n=1 Tax=Athelia psychrophila TaxID=1759441 RepID=A0A165XFE5_9AGAM|nr:hypothetical protein FIBSPDRAFT_964742 [Fibularhizoctonia sp. CBS 109695]
MSNLHNQRHISAVSGLPLHTRSPPLPPPPGPIDRWITSVSRAPNAIVMGDYLMRGDGAIEHVHCRLDVILAKAADTGHMFEDPQTSTLYLSARLPKGSKVYGLIVHSPRIIVDKFVGYPSDHAAPEWTRRTHPTLEFQQPRAAFADIFLRLAINKHNRGEPGLPFRMREWVKSALIQTWYLRYGNIAMFQPVTPRQQHIMGNTRAHKHDSKLYARRLDNNGDTGDSSVVRLLWPQTAASLEIEPFPVIVEEKDISMHVNLKQEADDVPEQFGEGAHLTLKMVVKEEVL